MSDGESHEKKVVPLNEVIDLIEALTSGRLKSLLGRSSESECTEKCGVDCACHISDCDCHVRHCKCHGVVTGTTGEFLSVEEFLQLREARISDLRRQLQSLELPADFNKTES